MIEYIFLAVILFVIGVTTVLVRKNAIISFLGVEFCLNAANLAFVTFSKMNGDVNGQVAAFFVITVAASEVVVGLALVILVFRAFKSVSLDLLGKLRN